MQQRKKEGCLKIANKNDILLKKWNRDYCKSPDFLPKSGKNGKNKTGMKFAMYYNKKK